MMIEALLLVVAALQDHRVAADEGQIFPLDMALNSADDQYDGCSKEMEKKVRNTYLDRELKSNSDFKKVWEIGQMNIDRNFKDKELKKDHKIALYAYTYPGNENTSSIFNTFNEDTRNGRKKYTANTYNWYSLHFLLTDAIHILKKTQTECDTTFRGTKVAFKGQVFTSVRFGSFTSSSTKKYVAENFGQKSCFKIQTCKGARIARYSKDHDEEEVLIPPYEVFKITEIKTRNKQNKLWCDTVFVLNSTGVWSDLNCTLFRRP
nr:NAD(P)(+)--arginine ADP-ribosyltransferase 2-like [Danio rerio]|eukprot:XP_021327810.1 NAD(P)(+)--arginine ADP-ribosyltransferase 2-like [Danio rerio]